ncbi:MAG TPA: HEPN domain-containing protein [Thermoclostridium sp.]|nr:HEPN domain-containing protein [Thermoclostridium sp.]
MDNNEKYSYWEEYAQYDLDTANVMFDTERYLYSVFMCQQAIEKIVKGIYVLYTGEEPVKTHNIALVFNNLCDRGDFRRLVTEEDFDRRRDEYTPIFVRLLAFYISARYPAYKEKLTSMINKTETEEIMVKAKEAFLWVQSLKKFST